MSTLAVILIVLTIWVILAALVMFGLFGFRSDDDSEDDGRESR
jgi:hypothetical protein